MTWDVSTDTVDIAFSMSDTTVLHSDWGEIGGTMSNQTDLQNALNAKQDTIPANTYDPYGAASSAVSAHNSANDAHSAKFAAKQDTIADLSTIRSGASAGATAYQKPASGITSTDMATAVQTSLGKADSALQDAPSDNKQYARKNGAWAEVQGGGGTGDHAQLSNRDAANQHPIGAIQGLQAALDGKGTYSRPSGGIPKTDLASAVQTSLGKADTALQEHQSLSAYRTAAQQDAIHDSTKQDTIADLATIREGAALGATAIQEHQSLAAYSTTSQMNSAIGAHHDATKLDASQKGANGGVAELDSAGKVPSAQLPSYVDDVLEYASTSAFPATGEAGKIYVATDTNKTYRWGGSSYVEISPSLALGETSSTAYRGDRGADAYSHSQDATAHVTASDKATWNAKQDAIPANTYDEYGAATSAVSTHNGAADAHSDIRADVASKYAKPSGGIPKSDLASGVQVALLPEVAGGLGSSPVAMVSVASGIMSREWVQSEGYGRMQKSASVSDVELAFSQIGSTYIANTEIVATFYNIYAAVAPTAHIEIADLMSTYTFAGDVVGQMIYDPVWGYVGCSFECVASNFTATVYIYDTGKHDPQLYVESTSDLGFFPKMSFSTDGQLIKFIEATKFDAFLIPSDSKKQDVINDLATIRSGAALGATALQEHQSLAGYATQSWVGQQGYLTQHQSLAAYRTATEQDAIHDATKENTANKVTSISSASTDTQYPSAKCVYDIVGNIESLLEGVL